MRFHIKGGEIKTKVGDFMKNIEISKEMKKLSKILKEVPKDRQPIAQSLFEELVFMQKTLVKLKEQIEEEGPTSMFKQGKQEFLREHPALKGYNTTIQRYSLLYKQLTDLLPPTTGTDKSDPLIDFIKEA